MRRARNGHIKELLRNIFKKKLTASIITFHFPLQGHVSANLKLQQYRKTRKLYGFV